MNREHSIFKDTLKEVTTDNFPSLNNRKIAVVSGDLWKIRMVKGKGNIRDLISCELDYLEEK